ncbi:MAG: LegC family aminotransferase [Elusimicrobia bacterium]|nr:LegC family aminotransferase [Elusimicrobiota bacterium]
MTRRMIPLSEPVLGGNEWKYVKEALDTGWVSTAGPFIERFEKAFAAAVRSPHAVAAASGTAALHTALLCVGVKPGDEVLVPALTFVAPANAIRYCGAFPVFMDADPATYQMDAAKVERFLREECEMRAGVCVDRSNGRPVRAVVAVHLLGLACEIDRIAAAARERGVKVVEDAAEALGVSYKGRAAGTFGDMGCFSFNGNKIVTSGGGGMIVSADAALARKAAYLTTQAKDDPEEYVHNEIGYNYRMTTLQAALGLAQLEQLPGFVARKRAIAAAYDAAFAAVPGIVPMPKPAGVDATFWLYTVRLRGADLETRKRFIKGLHARGVGARPLWHTIHDLPPFKDCRAYAVEHATELYHDSVSLPSGAGLTDEEVRFCADAVRAELAAAAP